MFYDVHYLGTPPNKYSKLCETIGHKVRADFQNQLSIHLHSTKHTNIHTSSNDLINQ